MLLRAKRVRTRSKQGVRAYLTGTGTRTSLVLYTRPYQLGRPPLYLGANGLIHWSTRSKPDFEQQQ